jgi:hypothetical protein
LRDCIGSKQTCIGEWSACFSSSQSTTQTEPKPKRRTYTRPCHNHQVRVDHETPRPRPAGAHASTATRGPDLCFLARACCVQHPPHRPPPRSRPRCLAPRSVALSFQFLFLSAAPRMHARHAAHGRRDVARPTRTHLVLNACLCTRWVWMGGGRSFTAAAEPSRVLVPLMAIEFNLLPRPWSVQPPAHVSVRQAQLWQRGPRHESALLSSTSTLSSFLHGRSGASCTLVSNHVTRSRRCCRRCKLLQ